MLYMWWYALLHLKSRGNFLEHLVHLRQNIVQIQNVLDILLPKKCISFFTPSSSYFPAPFPINQCWETLRVYIVVLNITLGDNGDDLPLEFQCFSPYDCNTRFEDHGNDAKSSIINTNQIDLFNLLEGISCVTRVTWNSSWRRKKH